MFVGRCRFVGCVVGGNGRFWRWGWFLGMCWWWLLGWLSFDCGWLGVGRRLGVGFYWRRWCWVLWCLRRGWSMFYYCYYFYYCIFLFFDVLDDFCCYWSVFFWMFLWDGDFVYILDNVGFCLCEFLGRLFFWWFVSCIWCSWLN